MLQPKRLRYRWMKYLLVYVTPLVVWFSFHAGGLWSWSALLTLFGLLPFLELFTSGSTGNLSPMEEEALRDDRFYDVLLYSLLPVQYYLLFDFLSLMGQDGLPLEHRLGATIALGLSCGILGINAAHELGHRPTRTERWMSRALLLSSLYMHFYIEHNRGHHARVATNEDPASARYGENLYMFYIRTVRDGWLSAWELEARRLRGRGHSVWSWRNEMLVMQIIQIGFVVAIVLVFGWMATVAFVVAAILGFLLLESVNYIEHYGLSRRRKGDGYERTAPAHSWNSNHPLGRLMLLELSRHSDHHYVAGRKYQLLRHHDNSPQMPTGYPGMILLALVPPLWFRVMHGKLRLFNAAERQESPHGVPVQ